MNTFDKNPKALKHCDYLTISHIERKTKIGKERFEKKIEDILGEDRFEFRK